DRADKSDHARNHPDQDGEIPAPAFHGCDVKRPRGKAGNQRANQKNPAKTDETSNCRDKDCRKFQLLRCLDHAGTIATRPKKIEHRFLASTISVTQRALTTPTFSLFEVYGAHSLTGM